MDTLKKVLKVSAALFVVFALSGLGVLSHRSQKAEVISSGTSAYLFSVFNRNEVVLEAQTILKNLGLYTGKTSGLFGFKTRDALREYQRTVSLPQTGILDIPTQQKLFAPPPVVIEYTPINHTKKGDQFLYEWTYYMSGNRTDFIELQGVLVPINEKISYGNHVEVVAHMLVTESGEYNVHNISDNSLDSFSDNNVIVSGYIIQNQGDLNRPTIVINYVIEDLNLEEFPRIGYTEEGDLSAKAWVQKAYNESSGEYIEEWGTVTIYRPMRYNNNSYPTRVILRTERAKYAIENISSYDIEKLKGQNISLRGFLLSGVNEEGYPTIVVNYFE